IQGFPFFFFFFLPGNHFQFYGQFKMGGRLEESLRGQMEHAYFPVRLSDMQSTLEFHEILEETVEVGSSLVTSRYLNHPQGCFGYRIENRDGVVAYCTDTEHYEGKLDEKVLELAMDADILIYDCQYTDEEYPQKKGWGHSTWREGVKICEEAGVSQLVMFHHDPLHDDDFIFKMEKDAQTVFPNTIAASRDMVLNLNRDRTERVVEKEKVERKEYCPGRVWKEGKVLFIQAPSNMEEFSSNAYREEMGKRINREIQHLVVDLKNLPAMDSSALGTLAAFYEWTRAIDGKLHVMNASDFNQDILKISRFLDFLDILKGDEWEKLVDETK
ncbi:MAG: STAS domain-containing protein, partial [Planctomycetota bacterium]